MKKLLLLSLVSLCSCEPLVVPESTATRHTEKGMIPFKKVTIFEYKNHQYIKFDELGGNSSVGGVVHDPDCKYCKK